MQAAVGHRAANVGFPSRSRLRGGFFLLPGRARFISGKPLNLRGLRLFTFVASTNFAFLVDARVEGAAAAAPLRVDSLPQPQTHGGGDFAHLEAVDTEAQWLPRTLRGILLDQPVRSFACAPLPFRFLL
jgi:hypothetical protein